VSGACLTTLTLAKGVQIADLAFTPDGARLVCGCWTSGLGAAPPPHAVEVRDGTTGAVLETLGGYAAPISRLAMSAGGQRFATASMEDGTVRVWSLA
jgi:WD40 repeat protein